MHDGQSQAEIEATLRCRASQMRHNDKQTLLRIRRSLPESISFSRYPPCAAVHCADFRSPSPRLLKQRIIGVFRVTIRVTRIGQERNYSTLECLP
jgi:hypothetical protein